MKNTFLIVLILFAMGVLIVGNYSPKTPTISTIDVEKIHCGKCADLIYQTLIKVPGVQRVEIDMENNKVKVVYNDLQVNLLSLERKLAEQGFSTSRVKAVFNINKAHTMSNEQKLFTISVDTSSPL